MALGMQFFPSFSPFFCCLRGEEVIWLGSVPFLLYAEHLKVKRERILVGVFSQSEGTIEF